MNEDTVVYLIEDVYGELVGIYPSLEEAKDAVANFWHTLRTPCNVYSMCCNNIPKDKIHICKITEWNVGLPSGKIIGYKKCRNGAIVTLEIPEHAHRVGRFNCKCRCSEAFVLSIESPTGKCLTEATSFYDKAFIYRYGGIVKVDNFDMREIECATGIHFFMTKKLAKEYEF